MRCGFWHDSIMGPPKMEKRKASKPPSLQEKLADRRQLWAAVQDLILNLALRVPLMRLIDGAGYPCSDLFCSYVEGSLAENPWKPHTQGFRLLPWTWLLPYTLTWYIEAQIKGTEKEFRKQLVIPSVRSEPDDALISHIRCYLSLSSQSAHSLVLTHAPHPTTALTPARV